MRRRCGKASVPPEVTLGWKSGTQKGEAMRHVARAGVLIITIVLSTPLFAAQSERNSLHALREVSASPKAYGPLTRMTDDQLAATSGTASGFHLLGRPLRESHLGVIRHHQATLLAGILTQLLGTSSIMGVISQGNVLVQINIAIGDHITQINNAAQTNVANILIPRLR